ncbi:hypothetical protein [Mucilaginibacter sp.]|uniref:hypothetical protein n=1 Tax=Mucilaginibacter sp. TaxID=1882438 RepID=UPI003266C680
MLFYIYTTFIVPATVLIPIAYAFINYRSLTRAFKIILAFIIFSAVMNTIASVMARGYHMRTTGIYHIYTPFEFGFIAAFFSEFYNKRIRNILYALIVVFAVFCVLNTVFIESMMKMDSNARSVDAIILIILCMLFFAKNNSDLDSRWADHASNWVVAGLLLYYGSSLFMFIFFDNLTRDDIMTYVIWTLNATILVIEYILFAIGFHKCRAQQTISTSR